MTREKEGEEKRARAQILALLQKFEFVENTVGALVRDLVTTGELADSLRIEATTTLDARGPRTSVVEVTSIQVEPENRSVLIELSDEGDTQ